MVSCSHPHFATHPGRALAPWGRKSLRKGWWTKLDLFNGADSRFAEKGLGLINLLQVTAYNLAPDLGTKPHTPALLAGREPLRPKARTRHRLTRGCRRCCTPAQAAQQPGRSEKTSSPHSETVWSTKGAEGPQKALCTTAPARLPPRQFQPQCPKHPDPPTSSALFSTPRKAVYTTLTTVSLSLVARSPRRVRVLARRCLTSKRCAF